MCDEVEIKGYCWIYIGVMLGKFIQVLKWIGIFNLVIMLDEIDKIGSSFWGDLVLVLLEVLDFEQNNSFMDYYLDLFYDLFNVFFIIIVNQLDIIFGLLFDCMEVICLVGYIFDEKV